jgi:SAM-dependent methyltransferase
VSLQGTIRKPVGRAVSLLPASLQGRVRAAVARADNRSQERSLAREIRRKEVGSGPSGGLPVPPPLLRVRVSGFRGEREQWLHSGKTDADLIRALLARNGYELERMGAVLDFGCGCGRVARHWSALDGPTIHGADVSRSLVRWCRKNLPLMETIRSDPLPPLPYPDGHFDLVYALSVLTHLPEDAGRAWLAELVRILRPGGLLLFTVHGERFARVLGDADKRRFHAGEIVITESPELAGTNRYGAFHPIDSVVNDLLPPLDVELLDTVYEDPTGGRGVSPMPVQDNYLVRKRPR